MDGSTELDLGHHENGNWTEMAGEEKETEKLKKGKFVENENVGRKLQQAPQSRNYVSFTIKLSTILLIWIHFWWATYYFVAHTDLPLNDTTCDGYGLLVILFCFINFGITYSFVIRPYCIPVVRKSWREATSATYRFTFDTVPTCFGCNDSTKTEMKKLWKGKVKASYGPGAFYIAVLAAAVAYLIVDTAEERTRLIPLAGLCGYLLFGYLICPNKRIIPWHTVIWGIILQFAFGLLTIRWEVGRNVFNCAGDRINVFLEYAVNGSAFVYGDFLVYEQGVFAFKALAAIYFLGFIINILYYYGLMQEVVLMIGKFLQFFMGTSICESVTSAANIFLGMSESPIILKPYLHQLTDAELYSMMTSGFACVAGTMFAAYISFGANPAHLITASVMSAPAALCYSKLTYPETEEIMATPENMKAVDVEYESVLDAASKGAHDVNSIVVGIISSLVAFIAFVYFVNGVLSWLGALVGFVDEADQWTVELIMGKIFMPISYIMGVPWEECEKVGQLIGIKTMVNEFAAFQKMSTMTLGARSKVIATYSICGFSNPGSIGIMISTMGGLSPTKREVITRLVFRAFVGGAIVCFMTACIAGLLIPEGIDI